ncbi:hypothetical protein NX059_006294 [Plenodomus lindquistii]|nr:hypothetical protein NX059_006294 [Plenodomus lindquistii]
MSRIAAITSALFVGLASCLPYHTAPTVTVKNGSYYGVHSAAYNQDFFLGIPYAQPPVGDLRFRNPASLEGRWEESKAATQYSSECYGYGSDQWNYPVSEDCLYLNVIRPSGCEGQKLPVGFWIHGGGFSQGGGVDQRYNASFAVENSVKIGKPIIIVSINYRLSAWGFLSGSQQVIDNGALNLGLKDQRLAMHWVQENIEAFGGDPEQVSIWGESAGAASVGFQLTAFGGRDDKLFRGAIMQSGSPILYGPLREPLGLANMYNELVRRTNCGVNSTGSLECLRQLPAEQLNAAINITSLPLNVTGFNPVLDYDFIQKRTSIQLEAGEFVHVPIISGANSDEGGSFSPQQVNNTDTFFRLMTNYSRGAVGPALATQFLQLYPDDLSVNVIASLGDQRPGPPYGAQFRRAASYFGDVVFIAHRRLTCQTWAKAGLPAYCYRFNAIPAGLDAALGVAHFQEVAFVFNNLQGVGYLPAAAPPFENKTQSYRDLARFMSSSWVSFVHDLDPNAWRENNAWHGAEGLWPKYDVEDPLDFVFDANVTSYAEQDTYRKEGMELINANNLAVYLR